MSAASQPPSAASVRGALYVVTAPSGAGKTSLVRALVESERDLVVSVSHTTRAPRSGEEEGVHYRFVSDADFEAMVEADAFLEHATVFGHRYGTGRHGVDGERARGRDVLLEIDWQGARQVREREPQAVGVFILPPSRGALRERLESRGLDDDATIDRRLREAVNEMRHLGEFDFIVVNDRFERALGDLRSIVRSGRLAAARQGVAHEDLIAKLLA